MKTKELSGKEVRYLLKQNNINLSWLSDQLGISPQTLQERLKAQVFKRAYLLEMCNVIGRDIFGLQADDGVQLLKQPILDISACTINGKELEKLEQCIQEYVSIPSLQGCIGMTIYGDSMTPRYTPGDIVFVRPVASVDDIDFGSTYLLITASDRLLRNVYPSKLSDEYVRLSCLNETNNGRGERIYPDRELKKESILHVYKVAGLLSRTQI